MKYFLNIFFRFLIPLAIVYLAFAYLGTIGGIIAAGLYFCVTNNATILQNIAVKKYNNGDYKGALKMLETDVKINASNCRIRGTYAYLLLKLGNVKEAAEQIDRAVSDCRKEIEKYPLKVTKALVLWQQGDLDGALSIMEEVIKNYKNTNMYGTLGFLYIEKGDLDKALSFNLEAYDYNSTNPIILDNLGSVRYRRNEFDEAMAVYEQLLKAKPSFPAAFYNYALVLQHFGKLDEAAYMCRYALSLKFWSISTITREEVETKLNELEESLKVAEQVKLKGSENGMETPAENSIKNKDEAESLKNDEVAASSQAEEAGDPDVQAIKTGDAADI